MVLKSRDISYPSIKLVMKHLEANQRFDLSINYPELQAADRSTPLKIETLDLRRSQIQVNHRVYRFGEIQHCTNYLKANRGNVCGGEPVYTGEDDVVLPGDILVRGQQSEPFHLEDQSRKIEKFRRLFMEAVDRYLDGGVNPLEHFLDDEGSNDREMFLDRHQACFNQLTGDQGDIRNYMNRRTAKTKGNDTLTMLHPRAVHEMTNIYEELKRLKRQEWKDCSQLKRDIRKLEKDENHSMELLDQKKEEIRSHIKKYQWLDAQTHCMKPLINPPRRYTYHNRCTVYTQLEDGELELLYFKRLPDRITLREAMKRFTTRVLGGRDTIRVGCLRTYYAWGIISLPVGLKLAPSELGFRLYDDDASGSDAFGPFGGLIDERFLTAAGIIFDRLSVDRLKIRVMRNLQQLYLCQESDEFPENEELDKLVSFTTGTVTLDISNNNSLWTEGCIYLFNQWLRHAAISERNLAVKQNVDCSELIRMIEYRLDGTPATYFDRSCCVFPLGESLEAVIYPDGYKMIKLEVVPAGSASPFELIPHWMFEPPSAPQNLASRNQRFKLYFLILYFFFILVGILLSIILTGCESFNMYLLNNKQTL